MMAALLVPRGLAAISAAPTSAPASPLAAVALACFPVIQFPDAAGDAFEAAAIHDIAPPVDVFPYPPWMVATAIAAGDAVHACGWSSGCS